MTPNQEKLQKRVFASMASQCDKRGYATPVDVLIAVGALSKEKEKKWHMGKIAYLERACMMNLSKFAFILKQMRLYASDHQLKPSWTGYHQYGKRGKHRPLRFSKSGNEQVERAYATHYVDQKRIAQLKQEKKAKQTLNKDDADVCFPHCFFAQVSPEAAERVTAEKRRKLTAN